MAVTPKGRLARIESDFWSTLVDVMDGSQLARKMTPIVYWVFQRGRKLMWVFTVLALAGSGLMIGFVAGLMAARLSS